MPENSLNNSHYFLLKVSSLAKCLYAETIYLGKLHNLHTWMRLRVL